MQEGGSPFARSHRKEGGMSQVLAVALGGAEVRQVPKLGMSLEEVIFAFGSEQLVRDLRKIGALVPDLHGRSLLFDVGHANVVWAEWRAGKYARQLLAVKGGGE